MYYETIYRMGSKFHIHRDTSGQVTSCNKRHGKKQNPNTILIVIAVVEAVLLVTLMNAAW